MTRMAHPWIDGSGAPPPGDGTITIVEGSAFCISNAAGDVVPGAPHGLIYRDTRFLSELRIRIDGQWPEPLAAEVTDPFGATFVLQAQPAPGRADSQVLVARHRYVGRGLREDVVVRSYAATPIRCSLELLLGADFADVFEVKEGRATGDGHATITVDGGRLVFTHARGSFARGVIVTFGGITPELREGGAVYDLVLAPGEERGACVQVTPVMAGRPITPRYLCGRPVERATPTERLEAWRRKLPTITSGQETFDALLRRSTEDLAALRLFDPQYPDRPVLAAGAPWFMTLFGRDSLITSWMTMLVDPDLALGTLQTLARYQGRDVNPVTEEQPGRILHEMRFGEAATLALGGGHAYYGSVDATPLFVMLLGELARWGTRPAEVDALLPAADRCLSWIDEFGDRDGDGYVEYERATDHGLRNQGWKDSWDGIRDADGRIPEAPIALCEVQGYVYAALIARAYFAAERDDRELAGRLKRRADALRAAFNRDFWLEDCGWFALALDRDKQPVDALASNMGHCLWTGIVDDEKAPLVAARLLSDDCFSGWGVRTLARSMTGYNPLSYHAGSVWPHDNAIIAAGLVRYGMVEEAQRVVEGLVAAAPHFGLRLPELFSGLGREEFPFPVGYPTSCSPQAWAAASPLLMLRALLRFEPDVRRGRLHVAPVAPGWLGRVRLDRLPLAGGGVSLEVEDRALTVHDLPPGLMVATEPRRQVLDVG